MRDRFGAKNERSCMLRFHTQTAGSSLTAQQPDVNVVRTTLEALAAVLGGTQSLHTNARDEALGLPTEESAHLALRTQQIIAYETGITKSPDPLGGSYYIEELTDRIEARGDGLHPPHRRYGRDFARDRERVSSRARSRMPRSSFRRKSRKASGSSWA